MNRDSDIKGRTWFAFRQKDFYDFGIDARLEASRVDAEFASTKRQARVSRISTNPPSAHAAPTPPAASPDGPRRRQ